MMVINLLNESFKKKSSLMIVNKLNYSLPLSKQIKVLIH